MTEDAPNIDLSGGGGRLVYDKARRTIVSQPKETLTFDQWFLKTSSWGLTYDQLVTCSFTANGSDPGDVVYTSPSGSVMTRHMCSHWVNFYGAAQMGWNAALASSVSRPHLSTPEKS